MSFPLRPILLTLSTVVTIIAVTSIAKNQSSKCDVNQTNVTISRSVKAERVGGKSVTITTNLALEDAGGSRTFVLQYFLNGQQIFLDEHPITLDCGEQKTTEHTLEIQQGKGSALVVFFRQLPIVPKSYIGRTAEQILATPNDANATWDAADSETVIIDRAPVFNQKDYTNIDYKYLENSKRTSYLFAWPNEAESQPVIDLTDDSYDFGLYFGEPSDNPDEIFSFTCMLNDKQINAFNGNPVWSGKIPSEHGVVIRGNVEVSEEGWHQLRCVSLNSMYANADEINYYPYTILSTYIFKSNAPN